MKCTFGHLKAELFQDVFVYPRVHQQWFQENLRKLKNYKNKLNSEAGYRYNSCIWFTWSKKKFRITYIPSISPNDHSTWYNSPIFCLFHVTLIGIVCRTGLPESMLVIFWPEMMNIEFEIIIENDQCHKNWKHSD